MKPKRIILVRHGESESNIDHSFDGVQPNYTSQLTANGIAQANEAGRELRQLIVEESAFFYVSPFWRTRMTFEQITAHCNKNKLQWREEPRLREQEWGHVRNMDNAEQIHRERNAFGTFYYRLPDGESAADVYDRVSDFFGTMHRDFEKENYPDNAVLITHGMTIRLFLMRWYHWTVEHFEEYANPKNCGLIILERGANNKYTLLTEMKKHRVAHNYQRPVQI